MGCRLASVTCAHRWGSVYTTCTESRQTAALRLEPRIDFDPLVHVYGFPVLRLLWRLRRPQPSAADCRQHRGLLAPAVGLPRSRPWTLHCDVGGGYPNNPTALCGSPNGDRQQMSRHLLLGWPVSSFDLTFPHCQTRWLGRCCFDLARSALPRYPEIPVRLCIRGRGRAFAEG